MTNKQVKFRPHKLYDTLPVKPIVSTDFWTNNLVPLLGAIALIGGAFTFVPFAYQKDVAANETLTDHKFQVEDAKLDACANRNNDLQNELNTRFLHQETDSNNDYDRLEKQFEGLQNKYDVLLGDEKRVEGRINISR